MSAVGVTDLSSLERGLGTEARLETPGVETEEERRNYKKLNMIRTERRAKNREKLMAMKRFSGLLKRPEILGSVMNRCMM